MDKNVTDSKLKLSALIPGGMMYKAEYPAGMPQKIKTDRGRQISTSIDSKSLENIDKSELETLVDSLRNTFSRSCYHFGRFNDLFKVIEERQKIVPGEISWDEIVHYLHFELQAMFGAIRLIIDEFIFLIARKYGIQIKKIGKQPWTPAVVISDQTIDLSISSLPEIEVLRKYQEWYKTLNSYRNAFFHHGWIHGSGYGSAVINNSKHKISRKNALLMPDVKSIKSNSKPSQWTWNEGKQIDDVAKETFNGLDSLLEDIYIECWDVPIPPEGQIPERDHPNMIVALTTPILLINGNQYIIPVFYNEEQARKCSLFSDRGNLELAAIRTVSIDTVYQTIMLGLQDLDKTEDFNPSFDLTVLINPIFDTENPTILQSSHSNNYPVSDFIKKGMVNPLTISVDKSIKEVFIWRKPNLTTL